MTEVSDLHYRPFGADTWRDPYPLYSRLREEDPVHYAEALDTWVLTRFADVHAAALDPATFSSARGLTFVDEHELVDLLPTMVMMDPPDHTAYRRLVNRGFAPRRVADLEPALRSFVRSCIDRLVSGDDDDLVDALARPVPCFVVAHYLGVPAEDRGRFAAWTQSIVGGNAAGSLSGAAEALAELYGYFSELVARRRVEPMADLVSDLLAAGPDGAGLSTEEILGYAFVMVAGGNDTVTGLIGGAAELLTEHRDQRAALAADSALLLGAVEELLRLTSPVQGLCRVATADTAVGGVSLRAGSRVLLCYGAANRDRREFGPEADSLDVRREVKRLLSFSSGPHYCMGAPLARLQGRVVLDELLQRCPSFAVDAAAGEFAAGAFVRRYERLPFVVKG